MKNLSKPTDRLSRIEPPEGREEVTNALGEQVRRAVEVLVQCLDKADAESGRVLLREVNPSELYDAGLTVMMRLVFILCAEERGLLLLGDPLYNRDYALSTLRGQLAAEVERYMPDVPERRYDAWTRLLAMFRAVFGGVEHENLRMPALGGSLFDPDRFPFLEGRARGTCWRNTSSVSLPIDNRTVLLLLRSIHFPEKSGGKRQLSFGRLDVEQIGHVYEGLLEHTVARVPSLTLGLAGSKTAKDPNVALAKLESARLGGEATLVKLIQEATGRSTSVIRSSLAKNGDQALFNRVRGVCAGDAELAKRISPFAHLLRADAWGEPVVYRDNSFMVTLGADRRDFAAHYTPRILTENIIAAALTPLVHSGPAEGRPPREWKLRSSRDILELKVCDPAMGSGAFLIQACRYLGGKLVEAWQCEEGAGKTIGVDGEILDHPGAGELLPSRPDERRILARRLVAERCLYGVDVNPLAVELARLSLWLVTLAKGKPFGFLDHNLRSGDSLLGVHRLEQLTRLRGNTESGELQARVFGKNVETAIREVVELRKGLRATGIRDIEDIRAMERFDRETRHKLAFAELIADAVIDDAHDHGGTFQALDTALNTLAATVNHTKVKETARQRRVKAPFHWALEFPEIFSSGTGAGFDAVIGNPPWGAGLSERETSLYKRLYVNSAYKLINTFKFFIERMSSLVREKTGIYAFLVPTSLLEHIGCRDIRKLLLSQKPHAFVDCGDRMFSNVSQACCYGIVSRDQAPENHLVLLAGAAENAELTAHSIFDASDVRRKVSILDIKNRENTALGSRYSKMPSGPGWCALKDIADVFDSGIDYSRKDLGRDVFYNGTHKPENGNDHKVLRGRNLSRFRILFDGIWLRHNYRDIQTGHASRDAKSALKVNAAIYGKIPKILVRQTADEIICAIDFDAYYHQKSLLCVVSTGPFSTPVLCAFLNCPEMTESYRKMTMQTGRQFSQVKKNYLERLPVPAIRDWEREAEIESLVGVLQSDACDEQTRERTVERINNLVAAVFSKARDAIEPDGQFCIEEKMKQKARRVL